MKFELLVSFLLVLLFGACSTPMPQPIKVTPSLKKISYLKDVKPILDKRCVTCHSCYNSPCQAKLSSFEGVDRGASKLAVYDASRFKAAAPTRLFIDAKSTQEWRKKSFFSLTESPETNSTHNDSIMLQLLYDKKRHPQLVGEYSPEEDELICPRNKEELGEYLEDKPNHGMPYGFPALKDNEYVTLSQWLLQGAKGPSRKEQMALEEPSRNAALELKKWENFLNKKDAKHQMTARYIYEHFYLAHIYFPTAKGEFFELIRSYTPSGMRPDTIPTSRVFDDPMVDKFYYRFQKIHTTIVHKTHITLKFDDARLKRIQKLFIEPEWAQTPHLVGYKLQVKTNPFIAYRQIPVRSRYQFLLNNAHFTVKTFIRGPVCRGQIALNVIHDQFWIMFRDPDADISVRHPELLIEQSQNLRMPIEDVSYNVLKVFSDAYKKRAGRFYRAKEILLAKEYPDGVGIDTIWRGNRAEDAPVLTIFRHFNSASVHKGVLGSEPRTMWVVDYPQLERIYYSLVAGYDVFGNLSHQANVRRYTDFLRIEGELNFLEYMPKDVRIDMLKSWYINDEDSVDKVESLKIASMKDKIKYKTIYPKNDFIEMVVNEHILKSTGIKFDDINYHRAYQALPKMPKYFHTKEDFKQATRSITLAKSGFVTFMSDSGANNIFFRLKLNDGSFITKNLVINRWHDNVNSMFGEEDTLDASKDTMDIIDESIGSYPNAFVLVSENDLPDFLDLMKNMKGTEAEIKRLKKYFVSRSDKEFWSVFDWFNDEYKKENPIEAGLYDLNRYARTHWSTE